MDVGVGGQDSLSSEEEVTILMDEGEEGVMVNRLSLVLILRGGEGWTGVPKHIREGKDKDAWP